MNLALKILEKAKSVDQTDYCPADKLNDQKYLTQFFAREIIKAIEDCNYDLDAVGETLANMILDDYWRSFQRKQVMSVLGYFDLTEFVQYYLECDSYIWETPKITTLEEALEELRFLQNSQDPESTHRVADEVLCGLLESLGYSKVVREFKSLERWYA